MTLAAGDVVLVASCAPICVASVAEIAFAR